MILENIEVYGQKMKLEHGTKHPLCDNITQIPILLIREVFPDELIPYKRIPDDINSTSFVT